MLVLLGRYRMSTTVTVLRTFWRLLAASMTDTMTVERTDPDRRSTERRCALKSKIA